MTLLNSIGSSTVQGLGTWQFNVPTTDYWSVKVIAFENPPSDLVITIKHNGSPVIASALPTTAQGSVILNAPLITCTASDTLTVVLSSALQADTLPNVIKTSIIVQEGLL